jgi:hypothetical protein
MKWIERIDWILEQHPRDSQVKFLCSVKSQIEKYPQLFPTLQQELILARIFRHYKRLEKEALLGQCYAA